MKRISRALSGGFALVVVLPLLLLGIFCFFYLDSVVEKDVEKENRALASQFRTIATRHLQEPVNMLKHVADMAASTPQTCIPLSPILDSEIRSYNYYESLLVLDNHGRVRDVGTVKALHRRIDYIGLDLSGTEAFRQPAASGSRTWSNTFISPFTGKPTLTLSLPFAGGVVVGNIDLVALSDVAASMHTSNSCTSYIVSRDGRIIAHPNKDLVLQQTHLGHINLVREAAPTERSFHYTEKGQKIIGVAVPMAETGWTIVVEQPAAEALAFVRTIALVIAAVLVGAVGVAFIFSRLVSARIVKPLLAITETTSRIGNGDFSPHSPAGAYEEFHRISAGLNAMSEALATRETELEDRNIELLRIQEELRRQVKGYQQSQAELQESEERYRSLFESSRDVVFICTPEGRLIDINPAGVHLFGCADREEALRATMPGLHADQEEWEMLRIEIGSDGFVKDRPATFRKQSGEVVLALVTATALPWGASTDVTYRGIIRDITETRKLEQQLLHAQKMESIGTLAGGIAHDFNNILMVILSAASMLEKAVATPSSVKQLAMLKGAAERAAALTKSLLAFSRKQMMNPQHLDLARVIREAGAFLRRIVPENIIIELILPETAVAVHADAIQLEQIFMNLVANGRDAMPEGGTITVSLEIGHLDKRFYAAQNATCGEYAIISVSDTGAGIAPEEVDRIFDPFFTTKEIGKGTGLGLSMAYGIVKQHKGFIDVKSTVGHGSTFLIYLPLVADTESRPEVSPAIIRSGSGTILFVEDDPAVRDMGVALLKEAGYRVITAADGEEALASFTDYADQIDLVILDVIMPKKNGREVHDHIRRARPSLPVIFMTGYAPETLASGALPSTGSRFLLKPVAPDTLLAAIGQAFGY